MMKIATMIFSKGLGNTLSCTESPTKKAMVYGSTVKPIELRMNPHWQFFVSSLTSLATLSSRTLKVSRMITEIHEPNYRKHALLQK
jgi:hypothetical protein